MSPMRHWHLVDHRPGYLTLVDLWDIFEEDINNLTLIKRHVVADIPLSLYYKKYPSDLYLAIGDNYYRLKPREWEVYDNPTRFTVGLYDKGGRQYIRFVIHMNRGYKKAGAFFIDTPGYYTPLEGRRSMIRRIEELRSEAKKPQLERFLCRPYDPSLDRFSALRKPKEAFFNSTDVKIFQEKMKHWKPVQSTETLF